MDYEQEYIKALERARKVHNETEFDYEKGMMEEIFPELKESDDERIRKALITFFQRFPYDNPENTGNLEMQVQTQKKFLLGLKTNHKSIN